MRILKVSEVVNQSQCKLSGTKKGKSGVTLPATCFLLFVCLLLIHGCTIPGNTEKALLVSPYRSFDNWYKGELHCHSDRYENGGAGTGGIIDPSLPNQSARLIVEKFRELGYDFVFVTDHEYFTTPPDVKGILTLGAEEVGTYDSGYYSHGNAFDIHETIRGDRVYIPDGPGYSENVIPQAYSEEEKAAVWKDVFSRTRQYALDACNGQGGFMQINHPAYYGMDTTFLNTLNGLWGIEIVNFSYIPRGKGFALDLWDSQLSQGKRIWGTVGSDAHSPDKAGHTFVLVDSPDLQKTNIISNLRNGNFISCYQYGSEPAPRVRITVRNNKINLVITNRYQNEVPVITWYKEGMTVLKTEKAYNSNLTLLGTEAFVRAEIGVFDGDKKNEARTYTQPIFITRAISAKP